MRGHFPGFVVDGAADPLAAPLRDEQVVLHKGPPVPKEPSQAQPDDEEVTTADNEEIVLLEVAIALRKRVISIERNVREQGCGERGDGSRGATRDDGTVTLSDDPALR